MVITKQIRRAEGATSHGWLRTRWRLAEERRGEEGHGRWRGGGGPQWWGGWAGVPVVVSWWPFGLLLPFSRGMLLTRGCGTDVAEAGHSGLVWETLCKDAAVTLHVLSPTQPTRPRSLLDTWRLTPGVAARGRLGHGPHASASPWSSPNKTCPRPPGLPSAWPPSPQGGAETEQTGFDERGQCHGPL